ncbi:unnamed protein product [Gadus morhua 'NCC']
MLVQACSGDCTMRLYTGCWVLEWYSITTLTAPCNLFTPPSRAAPADPPAGLGPPQGPTMIVRSVTALSVVQL